MDVVKALVEEDGDKLLDGDKPLDGKDGKGKHVNVYAKITDFGLSTLSLPKSMVGKIVDCPIWLAPEVMAGEEYTEKVRELYPIARIVAVIVVAF